MHHPTDRITDTTAFVTPVFNDALNTYYLRLYGVGHIVKHHSDSERRKPLPPNGLHAPPHIYVIPVVEQCLEREIAHWVNHDGYIRPPIAL